MKATHYHINTLQNVTIKKQIGDLVVCNLFDEDKEFNIKGELVFKIIICNIKNIKPHGNTIK